MWIKNGRAVPVVIFSCPQSCSKFLTDLGWQVDDVSGTLPSSASTAPLILSAPSSLTSAVHFRVCSEQLLRQRHHSWWVQYMRQCHKRHPFVLFLHFISCKLQPAYQFNTSWWGWDYPHHSPQSPVREVYFPPLQIDIQSFCTSFNYMPCVSSSQDTVLNTSLTLPSASSKNAPTICNGQHATSILWNSIQDMPPFLSEQHNRMTYIGNYSSAQDPTANSLLNRYSFSYPPRGLKPIVWCYSSSKTIDNATPMTIFTYMYNKTQMLPVRTVVHFAGVYVELLTVAEPTKNCIVKIWWEW